MLESLKVNYQRKVAGISHEWLEKLIQHYEDTIAIGICFYDYRTKPRWLIRSEALPTNFSISSEVFQQT